MHIRLLAILALVIAQPAWGDKIVDVAVISDGEIFRLREIKETLLAELDALTEGEFEIRYHPFMADWTLAGIEQAFADAYADTSIDFVLAVGFASNQIGVTRSDFPKPTFLPLVFDSEFFGSPMEGNRSGKRNLSYIVDRVHFREHLGNLRRLAPYKNLVVMMDAVVLAAIPELLESSSEQAKALDVNLIFVGHDGKDHDLAAHIPEDADAVVYAGLPRVPDEAFKILIEKTNARSLPSFSLTGTELVELGALATDSRSRNWTTLARRNALSMQAVLLGEKAEDQPVLFEGKQELTLNMATARQIGLSPRFDVLSEAVLINEKPPDAGPELDLRAVARMALERNRDLAVEIAGVSATATDIAVARSQWLPQLSAGAAYGARRETEFTRSGLFAERTADAQLSLSQLLFSDDVAANITIQRELQSSREFALHAFELDTVLDATLAYFQVLQVETQVRVRQDNLKLTRSNYELARGRVAVGSASSADVYRWQSREASDRTALLEIQALLRQARDSLNRLLHQSPEITFRLLPAKLEDPFPITREEFDDLINNRRTLKLFYEYQVGRGLEQAPELEQLDRQISAKEREIINLRRDYWLPDFSLSGTASQNLEQSPSGGIGDDLGDWTLTVSASLPLYLGGARSAGRSRAAYELQQLQLARESIKEKIEQRVRSAVHFAGATYNSIDLSKLAADAAAANLVLVTDAYSKGVVSIIDLLDAQNASLQAAEGAANAVYDFLVDVINMQRAVGQYDFLLSDDEAQKEAQRLKDYISNDGRLP